MGNSTWTPPSNKLKTMIVVLLDRSGSMSGQQGHVVEGVNKFLAEQKAIDAPASIAFVRFDQDGISGGANTNMIERFRPMAPLAMCAPLTADEYIPRGGTPLLDAIGKTLNEMENDWRMDQPDRAIMLIVTDGQENASREFKRDQIKRMISSRQASDKWAFIYLGADVDAFAEAGHIGISLSNTAGFVKTSKGIHTAYAAASTASAFMRSTGTMFANNLGKAQLGEDEEAAKLPADKGPEVKATSTTVTNSGTWTPPA